MRKMRWMAWILMAVLVLSSAGCSQEEETSESSGEEIATVRTAYSPFIGGIGIYAMVEKGLDANHNIGLEIGAYGNTSTLMAVLTGDVDIAFTTIQSYMTSINALVEEGTAVEELPKIVYLHNESRGADGIVATSDITTVADLSGKTVSAQYGEVTHYMLAQALDTAGLTVDDINFMDMSPSRGGAAFIAGQLDAATTFDPYLTQAVTEAGGNLLISTADLERCIFDLCIVSADVAEEKPQWLYDTLAAIEESTQYVMNNLTEASELTASTFETTAEEVEAMCSTVYLYTMADNVEAMAEGGWLYDTLANIQDFYVSIGEMSDAIDFSQLVDNDFLTAE